MHRDLTHPSARAGPYNALVVPPLHSSDIDVLPRPPVFAYTPSSSVSSSLSTLRKRKHTLVNDVHIELLIFVVGCGSRIDGLRQQSRHIMSVHLAEGIMVHTYEAKAALIEIRK